MTMPLIEVGRAAAQEEALAGLARWKDRPPQEPLDPDYSPW